MDHWAQIQFGDNEYVNQVHMITDELSAVAVSKPGSSDLHLTNCGGGKFNVYSSLADLHNGSISKILSQGTSLLSIGRDAVVHSVDSRIGASNSSFKVWKYRTINVDDAEIHDADLNKFTLLVSDRCGFEGWDLRNTKQPLFNLQHHSLTVNTVNMCQQNPNKLISSCDDGIVNIVDKTRLSMNDCEDGPNDCILSSVKLSSSPKQILLIEKFGVMACLKYLGGIELWRLEGLNANDDAKMEMGATEYVDGVLSGQWNEGTKSLLSSDHCSLPEYWDIKDERPMAQKLYTDPSMDHLFACYTNHDQINMYEINLDQTIIRQCFKCPLDHHSIVTTEFDSNRIYIGTDKGKLLLKSM